MHRLFRREQILTIPNLLSLCRLLLIPVIIWLYCEKEDYIAAAIMTVLSGLTDIADGVIARKYHLVSDLGKILDPIADKLTQAALIFCLIAKYDWMLWLFIFFAVKELTMGISGLIVIKKKCGKQRPVVREALHNGSVHCYDPSVPVSGYQHGLGKSYDFALCSCSTFVLGEISDIPLQAPAR